MKRNEGKKVYWKRKKIEYGRAKKKNRKSKILAQLDHLRIFRQDNKEGKFVDCIEITRSQDKLLYQLRQLFAYLQYSAARYHDPVSFLQSTEMSSATQQDVQEYVLLASFVL